ncbi:aldose 1-epimerase [Reichenbachiella ulvae]|uniref:Aldose 1-epimerase n=1 Tax=Reichenbachiella ulvae TaxID=2980104 RepID=A0ABT3CTH2_9BACT|nr:hypothetical protein [Reichenbachiella ulvae]MCV9386881.1 hypothetical protein [Reichenbachiella ulvae]
MYEVKHSPLGRFEAYRLTNTKTNEYLEILTGFGAGINALEVLNGKGELISVVDGYRSEEEVMKTHHSAFKGSKLSPFPNRLTAGKFTFDGEDYQMFVNEIDRNNNLHGLLHFRPFEVIETVDGESECKLIIGYNYLGTDQGFPFAYELILDISFGEGGVKIETQIENTGSSNMPIGDGWHPYFQFENGVDQIELKMGAAKRISSLAGNEVSDTHGFEAGKVFGNTALDDCFEVKSSEEAFVISMTDPSNELELQLWQDQAYGYYQIYSPDTRKTLAVEPVTCPPNAFNTGVGVVTLKPGGKHQLSCGIKAIK